MNLTSMATWKMNLENLNNLNSAFEEAKTGERCPSCNTDWEEEETITQYFESQGYSHRKAVQTAAMYGCTVESPKHFGKNKVGIEIQGKYDGVSYWKCTECETVFDRWTMEVVRL